MVKIPHREDPGDPTEDGWDRLYAPTPAAPYWPEVEITDNPIVAVLLDATGEPLRTWVERPPFGFQPTR